MVANGAFDADGVFVASRSSPSTTRSYMPPELAAALKKHGRVARRRRPADLRRRAMIDELGQFALILALAARAWRRPGSRSPGAARRDAALAGAGEGAALGAFVAIALGFAALIHAFVTSDFSVMNVAANSHTAKPLLYKIAGAWGSHEGSMLLWCLMLTGYGAAMASGRRGCRSG